MVGPFEHRIGRVAIAAALSFALLFGLVGCSDDAPAEDDSTSDEATEPAATVDPERTVDHVLEGWQAVTLTTGGTFFGDASDLTDGTFLVLEDTYFVQAPPEGEEADVNTTSRFGGEIYMPLPRTHIPWQSVLFVQPLHPESPVLTAIQEAESENPAPEVPDESLLNDRLKAVFSATGDIFFGFIDVGDTTIAVKTAFLLQFKDEEQAELGQIESLDDLVLIPASDDILGSTNEVVIPLDKVLYIQTLDVESPIVGALTE